MVNRAPLLLLHIPIFLVGSLAWVALIGVGTAVLLLVRGLDPALAEELLSPGMLGSLTVVQILGMAAWAALLTLAVSPAPPWWPADLPAARRRLVEGLALRPSSAAMALGAVLGGLCVWTLPTWIAELLQSIFPWQSATLELVSAGLRDGPLGGRLVMAFAVAVSAPIFEELVFRGYVYRVLELAGGALLAMVGSTLLFAVYHMDPVHVVALLPTAAFLGFLRWRSGSLIPPILAHAMNNGLGVAGAWMFPEDPTETLPTWLAFSGFGVTLLIAAACARLAPPPAPSGAEPPPAEG